MPEPGEFPSLDTFQKRCLQAQKDVDPAPHSVVRLKQHFVCHCFANLILLYILHFVSR